MRRAGLARFCTFACVLGLATAGLGGSCAPLAIGGLTLAVCGLVLGIARRHSRSEPGWLVLSILLTGLFTGYLIGTVRVAEIGHTGLGTLVGRSVEVELELSGPVREHGGWQSAPAVVRSLRPAEGLSKVTVDGALGETVWLEVPPQGRGSSAVFPPRLAQGMVLDCTARVQAPERGSGSGYDQARYLLIQGIRMVLVAGDGSINALGVRGGVSGWFDRLRDGAREHLSLGPDLRVDEVLQGVVMGDTQGIDDVWLQAFRRSGTAHMLSVSGWLHKDHSIVLEPPGRAGGSVFQAVSQVMSYSQTASPFFTQRFWRTWYGLTRHMSKIPSNTPSVRKQSYPTGTVSTTT